MKQLTVYKNRTTIVSVSFGEDVSGDTFTSQIREGKDTESQLIADWDVSFETDGVDGEVILTLDDAVAADIEQVKGYMDIKRIIDGEPVNAFDGELIVVFETPITE